MRLVNDLMVPTIRSIDLTEMDLSHDDRVRYWELQTAVGNFVPPSDQPLHRVLGQPDGIQGCMQRTLQFVTQGLSLPEGIYSWYEHPRAAEVMPGAYGWSLLPQINSEQFGNYWGDCGRLYFWIRRDELERRLFERTWLVFQGH